MEYSDGLMQPTSYTYTDSQILTSINRTHLWFSELLLDRGIINPPNASEMEVINRIDCEGSIYDGNICHWRKSVETADGLLVIEAKAHGLMEWSTTIHKDGVVITPESCPNLWAMLWPTPELIAHIDARAKEMEAWVKEAKGRFAAYAVAEDWYLATLVEEGIQTLDQYIHKGLVGDVFESWRSVRGYKPNWAILAEKSVEELRAILAEIDGEYHAQQAWEKQQRDTAWAEAKELASRLGQSVKTLIKWGVLDKRELYPA